MEQLHSAYAQQLYPPRAEPYVFYGTPPHIQPPPGVYVPSQVPEAAPSETKKPDEEMPIQQPSLPQHQPTIPLPPQSVLVEPPGGFQSPSIVASLSPPLANLSNATSSSSRNDVDKPTCSLTIVCYSHGCQTSQVCVSLSSKYATKEEFLAETEKHPNLITTDRDLFLALKQHYYKYMCGFWRRWFSLKTLKRFRLLSFSDHSTRPFPVSMDEFTMQEVMHAYTHPESFGDGTDWIEWVFRLRQPVNRHALEFVEGWDGTRIVIVGTMPCIVSTFVGIIWTAKGGDAQTAFTIASFILTVTTVLLALLAVISGIRSN